MKTIKQFLISIFSEANWDYSELQDSCPELIGEIEKETREFIQEAIKQDRINVAEHALVDPLNHDGYSYGATETQYIDPIEGNDYFPFGGSVIVNKDSILNAPNITLE